MFLLASFNLMLLFCLITEISKWEFVAFVSVERFLDITRGNQ